MSPTEINSQAKKELDKIINDLFITSIDTKLNGKIKILQEDFIGKSRGLKSKIREVSTDISNNQEEIEDLINKVKSENMDQHTELRTITRDGLESIEGKLSLIQNENLAEILSKTNGIVNNQKEYFDSFTQDLDSSIKSYFNDIKLKSADNLKLIGKRQAQLEYDITTLIKVKENNQKNRIEDLSKTLTHYIESEKRNNSNFQEKIKSEFQKAERKDSILIRSFEEKLDLIKTENKKQISEVFRKGSFAFMIVLLINILILVLLFLTY